MTNPANGSACAPASVTAPHAAVPAPPCAASAPGPVAPPPHASRVPPDHAFRVPPDHAFRVKAWVDPQAVRHTLYVGHSSAVRLLTDRQALLVQSAGAAAARVPFPRIERIIGGPLADWSGAALAACAEAAVPVVFATRNGTACASLACVEQSSGRLDAELTLFAESPDAQGAWREGVRALRARLLCELWRDNGVPPEGALWEEQRRGFVYQGALRSRNSAGTDARCYALVVAQLRRQGLQIRYATRLGRWLEVALDLSVALQDLRALMAPLEQKAHSSLKLRARTFETSEAAQADTISWCVLILRRCTHEALKPWL